MAGKECTLTPKQEERRAKLLMRRNLISMLALFAVAWGLGFVSGYYKAESEHIHAERKTRSSYIDLTPGCFRTHLSRRDERAVCAMQAAVADYQIKRAAGAHP